MANSVIELLDMLFEMIEDAKGGLGGFCKIERDKALDILDEVRGRFPAEISEARKMMDTRNEYLEKAKADGYVDTLFSRRRYLPELKSSNFNVRSFGERVALNMPIQGTAADIIKIAMVNVHRRLAEEGLEAKLILQVHDELIVECPDSEAERVKEILTREMENAAALSVPLTVDAHIGHSWAEAH